MTWKQLWPKQQPTATFTFMEIPKSTTTSSDELMEEELGIEGVSQLVFTGAFLLLMGRAHGLDPEPNLTWLQKGMEKLGYYAKRNGDGFEISPCQNCAQIWEPETTPSQKPARTEEPQT